MKHILKISSLEYWRFSILCINSIHVGNFSDAFREEMGIISIHLEEWSLNLADSSSMYHIEFSSNEKMMEFQMRYL
jgi:hypothetical protein